MGIGFILWVILQYYIINSVALIVPALAFGSSFSWLLCPFDPSLWVLFLWHFLPFWHYKMLQAHLYFQLQPWNQPLL